MEDEITQSQRLTVGISAGAGDTHYSMMRGTRSNLVIRQGADGDYFYAIVSGRCLVTRETPLNREGIKLAELGMGDRGLLVVQPTRVVPGPNPHFSRDA